MVLTALSNHEIAGILDQVADLLEVQEDNPFRVQAYRNGANTIRAQHHALADLVEEKGPDALRKMPGIGKGLAGAIEELLDTGHLTLLERLEGEVAPEDAISKIPGIGEKLAKEIHEELEIDSLEELERAAHDGRLAELEGFGPRRVQAVENALTGMLSRSARRQSEQRRQMDDGRHKELRAPSTKPPVGLLLEIDAEYRKKAEHGQLKTIAPRRFNPEGRSWLPILTIRRGGWSFTSLFSNTARAHELGTTHDWVVIYYEHDNHEEQCTVVTSQKGSLAGKRVIRGREAECRQYYEEMDFVQGKQS